MKQRGRRNGSLPASGFEPSGGNRPLVRGRPAGGPPRLQHACPPALAQPWGSHKLRCSQAGLLTLLAPPPSAPPPAQAACAPAEAAAPAGSDLLRPEYCTDDFRMFSFKIECCPRLAEAHDWTLCPFQHPGGRAAAVNPVRSGSCRRPRRRVNPCPLPRPPLQARRRAGATPAASSTMACPAQTSARCARQLATARLSGGRLQRRAPRTRLATRGPLTSQPAPAAAACHAF